MDINEESVEIAKLSLWLRTARKGRKLNSLNNNIKCGNSLIDDEAVAGDKAFIWEKEFPQVFTKKAKELYFVTFVTHNSRISERMVQFNSPYFIENLQPFILNAVERNYVAESINELIEKHSLEIISLNILPDHVHLIIAAVDESDLDEKIRKLKGGTSFSLNRKLGIQKNENKVWAQKYHWKLIDNDTMLLNVKEYIETNHYKHSETWGEGLIHSYDGLSCNGLKPIVTEPLSNRLKPIVQTPLGSIVTKRLTDPQHIYSYNATVNYSGFDVVIGNPPYVLCQPSNTNQDTLKFYKKYEVASYKIDLFHLFYEKGISLLKVNGFLGFITPNTFLTNKFIQKLRSYILNKTSIKAIVNYNETVFEEADVDVITIILQKGETSKKEIFIYDSYDGELKLSNISSQNIWLKNSEQVFNIKKSFGFEFTGCINFGEIGSTYFGIQAYDRNSSISNTKENENFIPIIDGADVNRYGLTKPNKYFNFLSTNIKSGGDWQIYNQNRIVIRQIGKTPIVGFCMGKTLTSNTIYNLLLNNNSYNLKYIFCISNSKLIELYWTSNFNDNKDLFPKIKGYQIKQLPIKIADLLIQQPFIEKAEIMLSKNKDLQEAKKQFLNLLQAKFETININTKLEKWFNLSFADFSKELGKQKIKLTLSQESEWLGFFEQEKQKALAIKNVIDSTDAEIDKMVYGLYGLSEEEVRIVEGN